VTYIPQSADIFSVPRWEQKHPTWHKRFISTKPDKLRGHMWDFGTGAYVPYGSQFTKPEELIAAASELGLSPAVVNTSLMRIMVGDLMLAYIPKDEYERRRKEMGDMLRDRGDEAVDAYLATERRGVKPRVFETEEEYKDVRNHATRESNNRVGYRGRAR
jgi:hypothetical protein